MTGGGTTPRMRAAFFRRFGPADVLEVGELPVPTPGRGEVLVRVRASSVNPKDTFVRKGRFALLSGRRFPMGVGFDFAGEVAGTRGGPFREGDRVFGMFDGFRAAACAEYVVAPQGFMARAPAGLSFEEAAVMPLVGLTALQALRDLARLSPGQSLCIHGAAGGVGTAAIQLARIFGARVTATASEGNLAFCRALGAEVGLDYTRTQPTSGGPYDAFFDVFGNQGFAQVRPALAARGVYISTVLKARVFWDVARTWPLDRRARLVLVRPRSTDLDTLRGWLEEGRLRPVIDRTLPLEQIREAHALQESKHVRGKVAIRIG